MIRCYETLVNNQFFNKTPTDSSSTMTNESEDSRIEKIDQKLRILIVLAVCQAVVTGLIFIYLVLENFIPSNSTFLLFLMGLGVFFYVFRSRVPGWFGNLSRFIFANLFEMTKSESIKK